jgi:hypothetical protein
VSLVNIKDSQVLRESCRNCSVACNRRSPPRVSAIVERQYWWRDHTCQRDLGIADTDGKKGPPLRGTIAAFSSPLNARTGSILRKKISYTRQFEAILTNGLLSMTSRGILLRRLQTRCRYSVRARGSFNRFKRRHRLLVIVRRPLPFRRLQTRVRTRPA